MRYIVHNRRNWREKPESFQFLNFNFSKNPALLGIIAHRVLSPLSPYGYVRHFSCHSVFAVRCRVANGRSSCVFRLSMFVTEEVGFSTASFAGYFHADYSIAERGVAGTV